MEKRYIILATIIMLILIPVDTFAEDSLLVHKWNIHSTLEENGDLTIVEDISYDFNEKFNGIYRDIVLKDIDKIEALSVYEIVNGKEIEYSRDQKAKKGDSKVYSIDEKGSTMNMMIFSPSKNEEKTFRLKYILKNVATRHTDTGELYYKFLGEENDTPIKYFSANIILPEFHKDEIKIFGHGPSNGEINFVNEYIKLEVEDVEPNTFIEARVLFPLDYIANSNRTDSKSLDGILAEEKSLVEEIEKDAVRKEKRKNILNNISLGMTAFGVAITWFIFNKFRRNTSIYEETDRPNPDDISPAELSAFMGLGINARSSLATLFDLSRRNFISVEEIDKEFSFTREDSSGDLLEHEAFLLDWFFNDIGDGNTVSTKEISNSRENQGRSFYSQQSKWIKLVNEQLKSRDYYDTKAKKIGIYMIILSILGITLGGAGVGFTAYYGILLILLSILTLIYGVFLLQRKTDRGYILKNIWKDFQKDIKKSNIKNELSEDQNLIYAIALGLPMNILNQYRTSVATSYYPLYWGHLYFLTNSKGGSRLEDKYNSSLYGNTGSSTSSSSGFGGGGGFTGGGGGGAGGGGTGGF